jgi:hypothetical protein
LRRITVPQASSKKGGWRMQNNFVKVRGEKYYVEGGILDLFDKKITEITEIKGLKNLIDLTELYLGGNQIEEVKGWRTSLI